MNIADYLRAMASRSPHVAAIHVARTAESISFEQLWIRAGRVAAGLRAHGIVAGDRILLMVEPGIDFVAAAFGVLQLGASPVFIDPGLGRKYLLDCVEKVAPQGMIAVRLLHALRALQPRAFRGMKVKVSMRPWPGTTSFASLIDRPPHLEVAPRTPDDAALIAFTTGSTGEPKGVSFPHRVIHAQIRAYRSMFEVKAGDVYLAILPLLSVMGPGLECTIVLPDINPRKPASVDAATLAKTIQQYQVTHTFGSPAVWDALGRHCVSHDVRLPTLRSLIMGGAPVSPQVLGHFSGRLAPGVEPYAPYGATEAVPVTNVGAEEIRAEMHRGPPMRGSLVGRPVQGVEIRVLPISDGPLSDASPVPNGVIGEVAVRGEIVSPSYFARADADARTKVPDASGVWHRMGDLGFFDDDGRLWFCGRKSERVETERGHLYTACVEPVFTAHPHVRRVAVVGLGERPRQRAVLVVEPESAHWPRTQRARERMTHELLTLGSGVPIQHVLFHRSLPVDIRHNAKILRADLARWAAGRIS